jgi:hypothetical protein
MSLVEAVRGAVEVLALAPADQGAVQLALTYAAAVDAGEPVEKVGPPLLAVLEALGMTPRARAALTKGVTNGVPVASPLDELRARRAARQHGPEDLDPAAP